MKTIYRDSGITPNSCFYLYIKINKKYKFCFSHHLRSNWSKHTAVFLKFSDVAILFSKLFWNNCRQLYDNYTFNETLFTVFWQFQELLSHHCSQMYYQLIHFWNVSNYLPTTSMNRTFMGYSSTVKPVYVAGHHGTSILFWPGVASFCANRTRTSGHDKEVAAYNGGYPTIDRWLKTARSETQFHNSLIVQLTIRKLSALYLFSFSDCFPQTSS